jgi:hypothetical protein
VYLIWVMLFVLVACYGLCAALVLFAERTIRPRGAESVVFAVQSNDRIPPPATPG